MPRIDTSAPSLEVIATFSEVAKIVLGKALKEAEATLDTAGHNPSLNAISYHGMIQVVADLGNGETFSFPIRPIRHNQISVAGIVIGLDHAMLVAALLTAAQGQTGGTSV